MKNIREIVDEIQDLFFKYKEDTPYFLRYTQEGYVDSVELIAYFENVNVEIHLWDSENESRKWLEEINDYTDFKDHIIQQLNTVLKEITQIKKIIK